MNRGEFGRECFKRVGVPANGKTLTFFIAWCAFEDTQARNNPCATEERFGDSTDFNSVGVQNYPTWQDGVDAWVLTIENGFYTNLLRVLRKSTSSGRAMLNALDAAPWGSHPNTALYELVEREYDKYNIEVPGSATTVAPKVKENVVSEKLFKKNEDGTFSEVGEVEDETKAVVPAPVTTEDTLEDRVAAQEAAEAEATKETEAAEATKVPVEEAPKAEEAPTPSVSEGSLKDKVVAEAEAFLARVKGL